MSVLAYVHQLFNVDQCQAYIHTLRWKDRPLQCPRCQSQDVDPWGQYHYRPESMCRLQAHLQRPHRDPLAPEQEAAVVLDPRHLPVVPVVLVATDCSGVRGPYPYELSLVLVAA